MILFEKHFTRKLTDEFNIRGLSVTGTLAAFPVCMASVSLNDIFHRIMVKAFHHNLKKYLGSVNSSQAVNQGILRRFFNHTHYLSNLFESLGHIFILISFIIE